MKIKALAFAIGTTLLLGCQTPSRHERPVISYAITDSSGVQKVTGRTGYFVYLESADGRSKIESLTIEYWKNGRCIERLPANVTLRQISAIKLKPFDIRKEIQRVHDQGNGAVIVDGVEFEFTYRHENICLSGREWNLDSEAEIDAPYSENLAKLHRLFQLFEPEFARFKEDLFPLRKHSEWWDAFWISL